MIGNRIKKLREELNITQEELARKIGVSPSAIGMYERDFREANDEIKIKMCELFNCSLDYLIGNSDIKQNKKSAVVLVYGTIPAGVPMEMIEDVPDYLCMVLSFSEEECRRACRKDHDKAQRVDYRRHTEPDHRIDVDRQSRAPRS